MECYDVFSPMITLFSLDAGFSHLVSSYARLEELLLHGSNHDIVSARGFFTAVRLLAIVERMERGELAKLVTALYIPSPWMGGDAEKLTIEALRAVSNAASPLIIAETKELLLRATGNAELTCWESQRTLRGILLAVTGTSHPSVELVDVCEVAMDVREKKKEKKMVQPAASVILDTDWSDELDKKIAEKISVLCNHTSVDTNSVDTNMILLPCVSRLERGSSTLARSKAFSTEEEHYYNKCVCNPLAHSPK